MNRTLVAGLLTLAGVLAVRAQAARTLLYTESFRRDSTQITAASFEARLDPRNPVYRDRIKDAHGVDRYVLSMTPRGPEGNGDITAWQVKLRDLRHSIYDNILLPSQEVPPDPRNNPGLLNPGRYAAVPIDAQRIIKVDGFYVVLEVKQYHFTPLDSPYLDSMTVDVKFTNADPRTPGDAR